jgi:putative flavoprotein involved in K+ transport
MSTIATVVIGAGHAGLAVSRLLSDAQHEHIVLERGRVAERWRSERWDSLHLLSPAWMTRLPGFRYRGSGQDLYLSAREFVDYLDSYADSFGAPVVEGVTVERVVHGGTDGGPFQVVTDSGTYAAEQVVVATGPHGNPVVPAGVDPSQVLTSAQYRNPGRLADGAVLVVGASSSGVQIADELNRAGREVVLAVGRHTRMPRRYRGMDAFWWLEATGRLARTIDDVADPVAARTEPSVQVIGRNEAARRGSDLDLSALQRDGVRLVGRMQDLSARYATFDADLSTNVACADERMHRFLDAADEHARRSGLEPELAEPSRPMPFVVPAAPTRLDLRAERITTVVLATGFRADHRWVEAPRAILDGQLRQYRGVTPVPGLYVMGQRFQHRRDSAFIDGARHDAGFIVEQLTARSKRQGRQLDAAPSAGGATGGAG